MIENTDAPDATQAEAPVDDTIQSPPASLPPLLDDNLNFSEGYQDRIGEHAAGANFKNLSDVFKTNKELHSTLTKVNQEKSEMAKTLESLKSSPPEEIPTDINEYKKGIEIPELPEGVELTPEVLDSAVEFAIEKGYSPKALSDFLTFDLKRAEMERESSAVRMQENIDKARETIVGAVGEQDYEMTISNAKYAAEALKLPLSAEDLVNQPNMVLSLAKIRDSLGEGTLKGASVNGVMVANGSKLDQAKDIISNPDNPLYKAFHDSADTRHAWAHQERARLISESAQ